LAQPPFRAWSRQTGEDVINTRILRARIAYSRSAWIAAAAIPLMLLAPALWNGYPLLQWDTGGYLARWYEGYLVPSRSTVFGIYLHFGEDAGFWLNLGIQALATLWIVADVARLRHGAALAADRDGPRTDAVHRAAVAGEYAVDRHLCRTVGTVAVYSRRMRREDFTD
jgi:hypothetical protein